MFSVFGGTRRDEGSRASAIAELPYMVIEGKLVYDGERETDKGEKTNKETR